MKKNDFILIGIVIVIIVCSSILINVMNKSSGNQVEILIDGTVTKTFSLDDTIHYTIETQTGYNELVIEKGKAEIVEASCPDKICINQKYISKAGESIICLPNKVVIRIVGATQSDVDSVAN